MADQLPAYTFRRGACRYDWDTWLNGSIWRLRRGVDFSCGAGAFRSSANKMARKRGARVHTKMEDGDTIVIQAVKR